jgi:hypothetical protein
MSSGPRPPSPTRQRAAVPQLHHRDLLRAGRGEVRLGGGDRPGRPHLAGAQAHRHGPGAPRERGHAGRGRPQAGRLHGRRPPRRPHLEVRQRREGPRPRQPFHLAAAREGHAVRRPPRPGRHQRHGPVDPAGSGHPRRPDRPVGAGGRRGGGPRRPGGDRHRRQDPAAPAATAPDSRVVVVAKYTPEVDDTQQFGGLYKIGRTATTPPEPPSAGRGSSRAASRAPRTATASPTWTTSPSTRTATSGA